jgi:uncharacterized DUF497 family protein
MKDLAFEWDPAKDRSNQRKHGVTFEEASTVFQDKNAIRYYDPEHSDKEDRFLMFGISHKVRVLVVCHCFRINETTIRIISARKATKHESEAYWE